MVLPSEFHHRFIAAKYFLNSYRALTDGEAGIRLLEEKLTQDNLFLSDWKILWIGTCAILRTAIDLFQVDARSCINSEIRKKIKEEWNSIKENEAEHPIFWHFLKKERDQILHEYSWSAYQAWMREDGTFEIPKLSLLLLKPESTNAVLLMNHGFYSGKNSLELLKEAAKWVQERIYSAITKAGFDPDEQRRLGDFHSQDEHLKNVRSLLGGPSV